MIAAWRGPSYVHAYLCERGTLADNFFHYMFDFET